MSDLALDSSSLQAPAPTSSSGLVLVIEASPAITDMICCSLELAGYQAMACVGVKAALTWINRALEIGDSPALILLDVSIPATNGTNSLSYLRTQLREAHCTPPAIILLTTSKAIRDEFAEVERVILKPFHICDLIAEVQKALPLNREQVPGCRPYH